VSLKPHTANPASRQPAVPLSLCGVACRVIVLAFQIPYRAVIVMRRGSAPQRRVGARRATWASGHLVIWASGTGPPPQLLKRRERDMEGHPGRRVENSMR
jgi:hypothetical protein